MKEEEGNVSHKASLCYSVDPLRAFLNIHRNDYNADCLLIDWCHVKLLPCRATFCSPPCNQALIYSVI